MGRHNELHSLACSLRAKGGDEDDIAMQLMDAPCRFNGNGPTPENEVRRIAKSVCDKYQRGEAYRKFEDGFFAGKSPLEEFGARRALSVSTLEKIGVVGHDKMTGLLMSSKTPERGFDFERMIEFPMRDAAGNQVGRKLRRANCGGIWGNPKNGQSPLKSTNEISASGKKDGLFYRVPLPVSESVLVVEGEIDWCAAHDAGATCVVGTPGSGCGGDVVKYIKALLKGREVILAPDGDDAGRKWLQKVAGALSNAQCHVRVIIPEEGMDLDKRLNPCLDRAAEMQRLIEEAEEWIEEGHAAKEAKKKQKAQVAKDVIEASGIVAIDIGVDLHAMANEVVAAIAAKDREIYRRGNDLVRCLRNPKTGQDVIVSLPESALLERVSRICRFVKETAKGEPREVLPPENLIKIIKERGEWREIREMNGISGIPVMRPDGSVWDTPGLDPRTGIMYRPSDGLTVPAIPSTPTDDQVKQCAADLVEILHDFPIEIEAGKSAWISALMTILCRNAIEGPVPMFMVSANRRGTGKDKLAGVLGMISVGKEMAVSPYVDNDEEMRKALFSFALSGKPIIYYGNITKPFGGGGIDAALTTGMVTDRLLGRSEHGEAEWRAVMLGTSNQPELGEDTLRRTMPIHMVTNLEHPENRPRSDFKYPDIWKHCRDRRGHFIWCAMTMIRAWLIKGEQLPDSAVPWGSYEAWCHIVRGALMNAGLEDPYVAVTAMIERVGSGIDSSILKVLSWMRKKDPTGRGMTAGDILDSVKMNQSDTEVKMVREAITQLSPRAISGETYNSVVFGRRLAAKDQTVVGGMKLRSRMTERGRMWFVEMIAEQSSNSAKIETLPLLPPRKPAAPVQQDAFGRPKAHAPEGYVADPDADQENQKEGLPF